MIKSNESTFCGRVGVVKATEMKARKDQLEREALASLFRESVEYVRAELSRKVREESLAPLHRETILALLSA